MIPNVDDGEVQRKKFSEMNQEFLDRIMVIMDIPFEVNSYYVKYRVLKRHFL